MLHEHSMAARLKSCRPLSDFFAAVQSWQERQGVTEGCQHKKVVIQAPALPLQARRATKYCADVQNLVRPALMLKRLFTKQRNRKTHCGPAGARAYAIGDVHGRLDLLVQLLSQIEDDNRSRPAAKVYLVFLGDLIDRGPDSKGVIDHLLTNPPGYARLIYLKGNHEEFFLGALAGDLGMLQNWLVYGGTECAASYGVTQGYIINAAPASVVDRLAEEVPKAHIEFLEAMADTFRFGDYLFVHAGIRPGVEIGRQAERDLRWIREDFLDDKTDHGVMVVHGHTIVEEIEERSNRIAIDTGAYRSGKLTAIGLEGSERWFLQATDADASSSLV